MGGGGKGGSESETKLPAWYEDAAKNQIAQAEAVSKQPFTPFQGGQVAGFTPQTENAMQSISDWSSTLMGTPKVDAMAGVAKPNFSEGGIEGYSSFPGYQAELKRMKEKFPGAYKYATSFTADPVTGVPAVVDPGTKPPPVAPSKGYKPSGAPANWFTMTQAERDRWMSSTGGGNYSGGQTSGH